MSVLKNKQTNIYINHSWRAGAGLKSRSEDLAWHRIVGHACSCYLKCGSQTSSISYTWERGKRCTFQTAR